MRRYEMDIDNGEGGLEEIEARNMASAKRKTERWARSGDWDKRTDVILGVREIFDLEGGKRAYGDDERWHYTVAAHKGQPEGPITIYFGEAEGSTSRRANPARKRRAKLHTGPRGGKYYIRRGRKVYK